MFNKRIDWQPGLLLSSEVFSKQDQWHKQAYNSQYLMPTLEQGIISIDINQNALSSGLVSIKSIYLVDNQKNIHNLNDINLRLDLNRLDEDLEQCDIYINFYESSVSQCDVPCIITLAKLNTSADDSCISSFYLGRLIYQEDNWVWDEYLAPMYYLNNSLGITLLKTIDNYLVKIDNEYTSELEPNKSLLLSQLSIALQFKIRRAIKNQFNLATFDVFEQFVNIICLCYQRNLNSLIENFNFNLQNLTKSFALLFNTLDEILNKPNTITQIALVREDSYFVTQSLNNNLFKNKKWYLKVLAKTSADIQIWQPHFIRICAPSRYKLIENMALNGLNIEPVKTDIHQVLIKEHNKTKLYKFAYGLEWDYIVKDQKIVCLINNDKAYDYRYVLYYQD